MTVPSKYAPTEEELEFAQSSLPDIKQKKVSNVNPEYIPNEDEMEFAESSMIQPGKEEIPELQSIKNAAIRGSSKGLLGLGQTIKTLISPGGLEEDISSMSLNPQEKEEIQKKLKSENIENTIENIEEQFPTSGSRLSDYTEKGSEIGTTSFIGPGGITGKLLRTGAASVLSTEAKKAGYGKTGQTIAEVLPFLVPDLSRRLVGANPRQEELLDFGRRMGLTEEQLVPAFQEENAFRRWLSKWSHKGQSTQDRLENSRNAIGDIYQGLRSTPQAQSVIPRQALPAVMQQYATEYFNLPPSLRSQLNRPFNDLLHSRGTGEDFIRFFQHVNYETSDPRRIQGFQNVTRDAIQHINPQLGQEFLLTNELYQNAARQSARLPQPQIDLLNFTKGLSAFVGLFTGNFSMFKAAVGAIGGQKLATEFLLNPRLQNLHLKTVHALQRNQLHLANKFFNEFREEAKEYSPEFYDETKDLDLKPFTHAMSVDNKKR